MNIAQHKNLQICDKKCLKIVAEQWIFYYDERMQQLREQEQYKKVARMLISPCMKSYILNSIMWSQGHAMLLMHMIKLIIVAKETISACRCCQHADASDSINNPT